MKLTLRFKGGPGSGNHGHGGLKGVHGGSTSGGGSGGGSSSSGSGGGSKTQPKKVDAPSNISKLTDRNPRTLMTRNRIIGDNASGTLNATGRKYVSWYAENGTSAQQRKANDILDMDHTGDDVSENSIRDLQWLAKNN